jgi:TolA-binding protein
MKRFIYALFAGLSIIFCSCGGESADKKTKTEADSTRAQAIRKAKPDRAQYLNQVKKAESKMKASKTFDIQTANEMIKAYIDYANIFQGDTIAPDYFFRAAGIATATGNYDQAIGLYSTLNDRYPAYRYVVEALYQEAMIYDSNLSGQDAKAKTLYEQIIKDYPKHKLATDAKTAIKNLGKSDEDLVKEFEKKNHTK